MAGIKQTRGPLGRKKAAFTLPELLITILLMAILCSLALIFITRSNQSKKLRDYSIALAFAQQTTELIRASVFSVLDDADSGINSLETDLNTDNGPEDGFSPFYTSGGVKYERRVEISNVCSSDGSNRPIGLKEAKITISWVPQDGGKPTPLVITALIADTN